MKNASYNFIDLMKYFMAILVIVAHTDPLGNISSAGSFLTIYVFIRIAVPYFYVMAGFFLFRKMRENNIDYNKIKKYILRILSIYIVWCIIYLPWKLNLTIPDNIIHTLMMLVIDLLRGTFFHLYFLQNLAVATFVIAVLLYKNIGVYKILVLAGIFYIAGLFSSSYYGVFEILCPPGSVGYETVSSLSEFLPMPRDFANGFLFTAVGVSLAFKQWRIEKKYLIVGFFLSWIPLICEAYYTKYVINSTISADCYVTLAPMVIFAALLSLEIHLSDSPIWTRMRKMSMYLYLVHPFWAWSAIALGIMTEAEHLKSFAITLLGSTVISYLLVILKERYNWSWLNKLG